MQKNNFILLATIGYLLNFFVNSLRENIRVVFASFLKTRKFFLQVTDYITQLKALDSGKVQDSFCSSSIAGSVFLESFITVAAALPSNLLAVLGMDKLGRKFFLGK